jgi:TetR/AcrR family transcriptional regulator, transcriptional repressor for nem operon
MARPRAFDEVEVLDAAREQFAKTGYAATSLDDLMKATGLGKGSLYGAFGDKHRLFLRVLEDYCVDSVSGVRGVLDGPEPAADRVRALVRGSASSVSTRGCMLVNSTAELNERDEDVQRKSRQAYGAIEDLLVVALDEARRDGDLKPGVDTRAQARVLVAVMQGMEFLAKTRLPPDALAQIADTALANLFG